jgi:hypothetical protein
MTSNDIAALTATEMRADMHEESMWIALLESCNFLKDTSIRKSGFVHFSIADRFD